MVNEGEDELICDLAETYNIYDMRGLPLHTVATFSVGLRDSSRIKMKLADVAVTNTDILIASCLDQLQFLTWAKTPDAEKGINRPPSVVKKLLGKEEPKQCNAFASGEDFEKYRKDLIERLTDG